MLRALLAIAFWGACAPFIGLIGFPWTFISGKVDLLYRMAMWTARTGVRLVGVTVEALGLQKLDPSRNYIFMCNHVSNLDPPIIIPLIPVRTSVLVKKELFKVPVLSRAMRMGSLVPVDRTNREAAVVSVRSAASVVNSGLNMTIFPEGTRSWDGGLLPFKKGPFYLAEETGVPVVPMTIVGTHYIWPKGRFGILPGRATVIFHDPIDSRRFSNREELMEAVREAIASGLPSKFQ